MSCVSRTPHEPLWSSVRVEVHAPGALKGAVLGAARSRREAELLEVGHSVEMNESSRDHQDVEQLVGVELETADGRGWLNMRW